MMIRGASQVARTGGRVLSRGARAVHNTQKAASGGVDIINADVGKLGTSMFHYLNFGLLAVTPLVFVAPNFIRVPMEVGLAVAIPAHAHISMNYVFSDYIPRPFQPPVRMAMLAGSAVVTLGLLKLAITGPGIVPTVLALWKKPAKEEEAAAKAEA